MIAGVLASLGARLRQPIGVSKPGRAVGAFLVIIWFLSLAAFVVAVGTYNRAWVLKYSDVTVPLSPITALSGAGTFIAIIILTRKRGWKAAIGSAIVGTVAAPLIFELPFDLIVMWRTYPPDPTTLFRLLYFLPLFLVEVSSFSLLTLSPALRLSRWTLFGFAYPSDVTHIALKAISKVLSFVAAAMMFIPAEQPAKA